MTPSDMKNESKVGQEDWAYVSVRPDAHMFWWLYYTTKDVGHHTEAPLIMWLQGGPGSSSTGFGNFEEIGPLTLDQAPRDTTWVKEANILFVDNPVGAGFSYVTNPNAYVRNQSEIVADLMALMKSFLDKLPEFQDVPFYIFSESYGGKMTVDFALKLNEVITRGNMRLNLKGVTLGNPFLSPIDYTLFYGPYFYSFSIVDLFGLERINHAVLEIKQAVDRNEWQEATEKHNALYYELIGQGVDWNNILYTKDVPRTDRIIDKNEIIDLENEIATEMCRTCNTTQAEQKVYINYGFDLKALSKLMNGKVRDKLKIIPVNVTWGSQAANVARALTLDWMKPTTKSVEVLLNTTNITVTVYTGQLDPICNSMGQQAWIKRLNWYGSDKYSQSARQPIIMPHKGNVGYVKSYDNLALYWILRAGHMLPRDAGQEALKILDMILYRDHQP